MNEPNFPSLDPNFFKGMDKEIQSVKKGIGIVAVVSTLASLSLLGLVVFVLAHFLAKIW